VEVVKDFADLCKARLALGNVIRHFFVVVMPEELWLILEILNAELERALRRRGPSSLPPVSPSFRSQYEALVSP
jgi:hypothetical protein